MPTNADPSRKRRKRTILFACLGALLTLQILQIVVSGELRRTGANAALLGTVRSAKQGRQRPRSDAKIANTTRPIVISSSREQQKPVFPTNSSARNSHAIQSTSAGPIRLSETEAKLKYLSLVYNEPVTDEALFDGLEMIYRNTSVRLPLHMIPCIVFAFAGRNCAKFWLQNCGPGRRRETSQDMTLIAEVNWPSTRKNAVGDNKWLEVTRWGMPEGNGYGCFFSVRKGSGVFVNTKRTIVVQNDTDAKITFQMPLNTSAATYCPYAREQGYDTFQILNSIDFDSNQLIYCTGTCAEEPVLKACVHGVEFRTGVMNDKPCKCVDDLPLLNCGNLIAPKGTQHICDQKWIKNSSSISLSALNIGSKVVLGKLGKV